MPAIDMLYGTICLSSKDFLAIMVVNMKNIFLKHIVWVDLKV